MLGLSGVGSWVMVIYIGTMLVRYVAGSVAVKPARFNSLAIDRGNGGQHGSVLHGRPKGPPLPLLMGEIVRDRFELTE